MLLWFTQFGCTPVYVRGTQIDYTPDRQEVAQVIETYRKAIENRDVTTLKSLASEHYYENGSTTGNPGDDYDYSGLYSVLEKLGSQVKAVKYSLTIKSINILKDSAAIDVEYTGQFLYTVNEQDRWSTYADKNRITLKRDRQRKWKFISGM
jgi:hypothetical protein